MLTYIANYVPLKDRLDAIATQLTDLGMSYKGVIQDEPHADLTGVYTDNAFTWHERTRMPFYENEPSRRLRLAEISLAYKHIVFLEALVASNEPAGMILEDDVVLTDRLLSLVTWLDTYKLTYDCIFLGGCCPSKSNLGIQHLFAPNLRGNDTHIHTLIKQDHPASRCTDGYIITANAAKKILSTIKPFVLPIDFELSYHFKHHNMTVFHLKYPVLSQNPAYTSSVQS